jgi:two-component system cell cycle sensor histidine kinase PleC
MRSAETSGVGAIGFALLKTASGLVGPGSTLDRLRREVSPVSQAVAMTALVATLVFVVHDVLREFGAAASGEIEASGFDAVLARGCLALAFAILAVGLSLKRRPRGMPGAAEQRRFTDLLATIPFGVACWTGGGVLVAANAQYGARLRLPDADCAGGAGYEATLRRLAPGGALALVEESESHRTLEFRRDDGSCVLIEERPLPDGGFVTLVTDITERRRADLMLASLREEQRVLARHYHEEKLRAEAASRAKTAFLAHLSHDIRTPLNHIIGFAEMMAHQTYGPLGDKRYLAYVEGIKSSGERLLDFFASILELAEFEGGRKALRQEQVGIDGLLGDAVRREAARAGRAGITLGLGTPCHARLMGDRFALERMLGNIVDNALRFTPAGGRVMLSAYAAENGVVLEVTDTGIGMTAEKLSQLSHSFAFGDAAFAREQPGTGLGVSIARAIAELSGGHLAIDSRPGLGTTVAISLPAAVFAEGRAAAE